jgi:hypothetical protein
MPLNSNIKRQLVFLWIHCLTMLTCHRNVDPNIYFQFRVKSKYLQNIINVQRFPFQLVSVKTGSSIKCPRGQLSKSHLIEHKPFFLSHFLLTFHFTLLVWLSQLGLTSRKAINAIKLCFFVLFWFCGNFSKCDYYFNFAKVLLNITKAKYPIFFILKYSFIAAPFSTWCRHDSLMICNH